MTKVDIFSGFLGAGKTTLIKKLIKEAYSGQKLVIIENEFGDVGIDGGFLKDSGIEITEMNSGCICCSLVGDFSKALAQVQQQFNPDRIIIEPSGVGKLSDVISAVERASDGKLFEINGLTAVADATKCKMYMKNFGEFFNNQIESASCIVLSHTDKASDDKMQECLSLIRDKNSSAAIVATPWNKLDGKQIMTEIEQKSTAMDSAAELAHEHHRHHDHDEECSCGCHHDHDHDHEHHHDHDEECSCGCHHDHDHEHHHHHDADDVFESFGRETAKKYSKQQINDCLSKLEDSEKYGIVLRAKGIVSADDSTFIHFDYIPGTADVRTGSAEPVGKICVIGSKLNKEAIAELFDLK